MTMALPAGLSLHINHYELIYAIDAFHDGLFQKLYYVLNEDHADFRKHVPLDAMQNSVSTFASLWGRAFALYKSETHPDEQEAEDAVWESIRDVPEQAWAAITQLAAAEDWDQVPFHPIGEHGECDLCKKLVTSMVV